jgi:chemotaxis protein CheC
VITSYSELNDQHIDILREIGNIGAGNAATSLSVMLDEDVHISLPKVRVEDYNSVVSALGGPEEMIVAVMVNFSGEANGLVLFILTMGNAVGVTDILVGKDECSSKGLSEMKLSAITEIGNILGSSYLSSIAELTGLKIEVSIPHVAIDMTGAILAEPVVKYGAADNKVMFIEESFNTEKRNLSSHVLMFTKIETLKEVIARLGLKQ